MTNHIVYSKKRREVPLTVVAMADCWSCFSRCQRDYKRCICTGRYPTKTVVNRNCGKGGDRHILMSNTRARGGGGVKPPHFFGIFKELLRKRCFQPPHFESLFSPPTFKVALWALNTELWTHQTFWIWLWIWCGQFVTPVFGGSRVLSYKY